MKFFFSVWISAVLLIVSGCGYGFQSRGPLQENVQTIHVALFKNNSYESGAETIFTSALINEIMDRSTTELENEENADAVFRGVIKSVSLRALTRNTDGTVKERRVSATIDLEMIGNGGEVLWSVYNFTKNEDYSAESDNITDMESRSTSIEEIADSMVETLVGRMIDDF
ncbi:MAG: LPS assembly lipoprotein LptE [Thermodesulfobacteriota bacterium]